MINKSKFIFFQALAIALVFWGHTCSAAQPGKKSTSTSPKRGNSSPLSNTPVITPVTPAIPSNQTPQPIITPVPDTTRGRSTQRSASPNKNPVTTSASSRSQSSSPSPNPPVPSNSTPQPVIITTSNPNNQQPVTRSASPSPQKHSNSASIPQIPTSRPVTPPSAPSIKQPDSSIISFPTADEFQSLSKNEQNEFYNRVMKERELTKKTFGDEIEKSRIATSKLTETQTLLENERVSLKNQLEDREKSFKDQETLFKKQAEDYESKAKKQEAEIENLKNKPNIHIGTVKSVNPSLVVSEKEAERIAAEATYIAYKHGWQRKLSHGLDQTVWPILKEQGAFFVTELRKKHYITRIERQNEKLSELKIKADNGSINIQDLDLATKLLALDQSKKNQEVTESFNDAQTLGQILTNIQILSADAYSAKKKQTKRINALVEEGFSLQEKQLAKFSARSKAQQQKTSEEALLANKLVGDVIAQRKKQEEKDKKQKERRKLKKELERKKQEEWEKEREDFLNTRDDD